MWTQPTVKYKTLLTELTIIVIGRVKVNQLHTTANTLHVDYKLQW